MDTERLTDYITMVIQPQPARESVKSDLLSRHVSCTEFTEPQNNSGDG